MEIVWKIKTGILRYQNHIYKFRYKQDMHPEVVKVSAEPHQLEYRFGDKPTGWTILGSNYSSSPIFNLL